MITIVLDWLLERLFKPNDPKVSGRELKAVVRGGLHGNTIRLFWLPTKDSLHKTDRADVLRMISKKYPGCHIRLASEEDPRLFIALKLRELFGYEWKRSN